MTGRLGVADADATQSQVAALLAKPASHGLREGAVERIETHVSSLFLAGDRVYKMKKAVRFGYVDFSTLARRHAACEAEVRLNTRTAPEIYLGVVPVVRGAAGALALGGDGGGDGTPVEWLVEMRRFDQDGLFDRMAAAGELTDALAVELADAIFDFHATADADRARDGAADMRRVIEGSLRELARGVPDLWDAARLKAFGAASHARLDACAATLRRRGENGSIRRCHGDLHLRNIVLWNGRPTLFDALEFSDALATIDLAYDLAFLLMDFEHRGLGRLANLVLNRYLGRSGDVDGLAALPLFMSARAAIRAHTNAAADEDRDETQSYLSLAERLLEPSPPRLIAIGGPSGTGKSTLARSLGSAVGRAPGALVLRSDVIRKRLAGVAPEERLPPNAYTRQASQRVFRRLADEAAAALAAGYAVIADAVYGAGQERARIERVAREAGVPFTGLWLRAPDDVLKRRVESRARDASDADAAVVARQLVDLAPPDAWIPLDAGRTPGRVAADARKALRIAR